MCSRVVNSHLFTYMLESIASKLISVCLINEYSLIVYVQNTLPFHSNVQLKLLILNNFGVICSY